MVTWYWGYTQQIVYVIQANFLQTSRMITWPRFNFRKGISNALNPLLSFIQVSYHITDLLNSPIKTNVNYNNMLHGSLRKKITRTSHTWSMSWPAQRNCSASLKALSHASCENGSWRILLECSNHFSASWVRVIRPPFTYMHQVFFRF